MIIFQSGHNHKDIELDEKILKYFKFLILNISDDFIGYYKQSENAKIAIEIIRMIEMEDNKILLLRNEIDELVRALYKSDDSSPENFYAENCGNAIRSYLKYLETHNSDTVGDLENVYESIFRYKLKIRRKIAEGLSLEQAIGLNDKDYMGKIEEMRNARKF